MPFHLTNIIAFEQRAFFSMHAHDQVFLFVYWVVSNADFVLHCVNNDQGVSCGNSMLLCLASPKADPRAVSRESISDHNLRFYLGRLETFSRSPVII